MDCLGGAPGVYSARYAGEHATDGENIDKLLAAVRGKSDREPLGKTFAEMTAEEKNAVSHRGIAVRRFAEMFFLDKPASEC